MSKAVIANAMKVIVVGGSGLIGQQLVTLLQQQGHDVIAASRSTGINTVSGTGLVAAVSGREVVIDVSNAPSFEDQAVMDFFTASSTNLLAAAKRAGIQHYIALSVVGTDRLQQSGYFRAKLVQENLIAASGLPYTVLRASQFFEFIATIAESGSQLGSDHNLVRMPTALIQPVASADVVAALAQLVQSAPVNSIIDMAGPEKLQIDQLVSRYFRAKQDGRQVIADPDARYFGTALSHDELVPIHAHAQLGASRFSDWLQ